MSEKEKDRIFYFPDFTISIKNNEDYKEAIQ